MKKTVLSFVFTLLFYAGILQAQEAILVPVSATLAPESGDIRNGLPGEVINGSTFTNATVYTTGDPIPATWDTVNPAPSSANTENLLTWRHIQNDVAEPGEPAIYPLGVDLDLGETNTVTGMVFWNYTGISWVQRGLDEVEVYASTSGTAGPWTLQETVNPADATDNVPAPAQVFTFATPFQADAIKILGTTTASHPGMNEILFMVSAPGRGAAENPDPANGNTMVDATQYVGGVSWDASTDPNILSISQFDVYWSVGDPNLLDVVPVNNGTSTTFAPTPAIDVETTYYWRVDTHLTWDANDISDDGSLDQIVPGPVWTFTTLPANVAPSVDAGPDIWTATEFLPAIITGNVLDINGNNDNIVWTIIDSPDPNANAGITDTTNDASSESQTAGFTTDTVGIYVIELTATDTQAESASDTMQISVSATPCDAVQAAPNWPGFNVYDNDQDCDVDIVDFVAWLQSWLDNRNLVGTAPQ